MPSHRALTLLQEKIVSVANALSDVDLSQPRSPAAQSALSSTLQRLNSRVALLTDDLEAHPCVDASERPSCVE